MPGKTEKEANRFLTLLRSTLGWAAAALPAALAVLLLRIPGFPPLAAAQATAGIIGLGGGLSYAAALRAAGGKVDGKNAAFVAVVWCLSCILGVTPLFFTLGTALEMTVNAFYSFAFCGALGGILTARRIRSLFPGAAGRDIIPSAVLWSLGFGLASVISNVVGEGLQRLLPEGAAWFMAYEAMALTAGGTGAAAILLFQRARKPAEAAPGQTRRHGFPGEELKHPVIVLILLCLPFYLNDLNDIFVRDWRLWLRIDFVSVKLFPLLLLAWLIRKKELAFSSLGFTVPSAVSFWAAMAIGALSAVFIQHNAYLLTGWFSPLGRIPEIDDPLWRRIDLTLGLALVGIVEETVFRGYLWIFLSRYTSRAWVVVVVSAAAFGLIHWSGGLQNIVTTSAIGAVYMALYLRTRSLPAIMVAHYLANFVAYSGFVPQSLFRFF